MTGYLAFRNSETTILSYNTMTSELNVDSEVFNDLSYGSTTNWDTANKLVTKRKLQISGSTTLNITNSINGQRGFLVVTASSYGIITLPGYIKSGVSTVLASGERCVYTYLYDGSNYYWQSGDIYSTTGTNNLEKEGVLFDHCLNAPGSFSLTTSVSTGGTGASANVNASTFTSSTPGILTLATGTTTSGRAGCKGFNIIKLGNLYLELEFSFKIRTLTDSSDQFSIQAGFGNTNTGAFGHGCYIYYDQTSTNLKYVNTFSSTSTSVDSGFTPVADTFFTAKIVVNGSSSVRYTINNSNAQTITTNIPSSTTGLFTSFVILKSLGTNDRQVDFDWIKLYYKVIA